MNKLLIAGLAAGALVIGGGAYAMSSSTKANVTIYGNSVPETFSAQQSSTVGSDEVLTNLSATLLKVGTDGKPYNYAADKIELAEENKKLNVTLKDGLKWQNGEKVTSKDYEYGVKLLSDPKSKAPYASFATDNIKGAKEYADGKSKNIEGFKIKNDKEFTIEIKKPTSFFDKLFVSSVFAPQNEKWVKAHGGVEKYGAQAKDILSSGEMKVKEYKTDNYIDLVKNTDNKVLADKSKVDGFRIKWYKDSNSAYLDYKAGKLNSVSKTKAGDKILGKKESDKADYTGSTPSLFYFAFNPGSLKPKLANAMYKSLDKEYINKNFLYNLQKVRNVMTPDSYDVESKHKDANKNDFDLSKAKELAKEFKNKKITFFQSSEATPQQEEIVKYALGQWKQLGLDTTIKKMPFKLLSKDQMKKSDAKRNFDVAFSGWVPDYPEASTFYNSLLSTGAGATSYVNWTDKEYDKEVSAAMSAKSTDEASKHYVKAEELNQKVGALRPIWQTQSNQYIKDGGYKASAVGKLAVPSLWSKK